MKTILLSLIVLFCSLGSYASADVKETVTIEKYGKTFNLTAPDGFCFLSNFPVLDTSALYNHLNRVFDEETGYGTEHLEIASLCEELMNWYDGAPMKDSYRIHFGMEGLQNFRFQLGSIKNPPSTKEFVSGMWQLYGDEKETNKAVTQIEEVFKKEGIIFASPMQRVYKGRRCVYILTNAEKLTDFGSALTASCWINDRSVTTYFFKNFDFFKSESELQEALELLKEFNNSIN